MNQTPLPAGRRLARNTIQAAGGRLVALVAWFVLTPAILRALGREEFGIWSLFLALTGNLAAMDLALAQSTLKYVAAARARESHPEAGAHATFAVLGYVILGAVWGVILIALRGPIVEWFHVPPQLQAVSETALMIAPAVFVLSGLTNVCMSVAQGYGRFDLANWALVTAVLVQAGTLVLALVSGATLTKLATAIGIGWLVGAIVGFNVIRIAAPAFKWHSPGGAWGRWPEALRFGGPMQISNILATLNAHMDKAFLARWVSLVAVTPYEIGSRVAVAVSTLPQLLLTAILPEASALNESGEQERLRTLYLRGSRYLLTAAALAAAPVLGCAERLLRVWLQDPVPGGALAVRLLAVAAGISISTGMATSIARGIGRTDLETRFAAVAVGVHLVAAFLLIPRWGLIGALCGIAGGNLVGAMVLFWQFGRVMSGMQFREVVRPILVPMTATGLGALAGWALDLALPSPGGFEAWVLLAVIALAASAVAFATTVTSGYFPWREIRTLLARPAT